MRILHLYRPRVPSLRAQAIQVLHTCHALALRGHQVTLLADRGADGDPLEPFGLRPCPHLDLRISPTRHPTAAGLWFRAQVRQWWSGEAGVILARDKRRLVPLLDRKRRHRVVLETHELDSALAEEGGKDASVDHALERQVAAGADAIVANCEGTLAAWEHAHAGALPQHREVIHNATGADRRRDAHPNPDPVVRVMGSLRSFKGIDVVAQALPHLPMPVEWVGGDEEARAHWVQRAPTLTLLAPVPYPEVPDLLARSTTLLLPLTDNLFGRALTSPLKLWDYLATAVPIVAPDLPSVTAIAKRTGAQLHTYRPGDPEDLARACTEATLAPARSPSLRTWDERAAELEGVLG